MAELQLPKLTAWVRFPSLAPKEKSKGHFFMKCPLNFSEKTPKQPKHINMIKFENDVYIFTIKYNYEQHFLLNRQTDTQEKKLQQNLAILKQ